jgi:4-amino-4-deoxy-L-arabinose transferase-like glycosyltransferase
MKIVNVLAGTGTVLCAGILGNRLLEKRRGRQTAWAVALAPSIVWWALPMLREPLAMFFAAATLAAATGIPR